MITVPEIREQLIDLLDSFNEDSVSQFEEWLASTSWNMHLDSDSSAQELVGNIQLRLAEAEQHPDGKEWLKKQLRSLLSAVPVAVSNDPVRIITSSSSTFKPQREWAFSSVGKKHAAAFSS